MTTTQPSTEQSAAVLQLSDILTGGVSEPCSFFERADGWRDRGRVHQGNGSGTRFWLFTEMDDMRTAYQTPEVFSNTAIQCDTPEPDFRLIPEMLDPPEHGAWRRLMGPLFSPGSVAAMEHHIRARFDEILDDIVARGKCDFVADVALRFPNTIFLELMGMPLEDADRFQEWETAILHEGSQSAPAAMAATNAVFGYFSELIEARRAQPGDDIVSKALNWQIDGQPVTHEDLLSYCLLLFMAGLDTVASQLSYAFYHLATHPADRQRLVDEPALIPTANEELLRYYAIVTPGRKVIQDVEVAGCPMKAGDMALLPLSSANRDPKQFERADEVIIDRATNPHIAFGAGPHRCLGSHLARLELNVAMQAWHERIPEYELDDTVPMGEHSAGLIGLNNLPLRWKV
jgi:cytochrome P450